MSLACLIIATKLHNSLKYFFCFFLIKHKHIFLKVKQSLKIIFIQLYTSILSKNKTGLHCRLLFKINLYFVLVVKQLRL